MNDSLIYQFLDRVRSQIRYAPAARQVSRELTDHLDDRMELLTAQGLSEQDAMEQAVAAMGDPYEIGKAIDRLYPPVWHRLSHVLLGCASLLLFITLVWNLAGLGAATRFTALRPEHAVITLDHALLSEENSEDPTLLRSATVFGEGTLGGRTFRPADDKGTAGVYRLSTGVVQLRFGLTVSHTAPWLYNAYAPELTLTDDLGRQHEAAWFRLGDTFSLRTRVLLWADLPDSAARSYTLTCSARDGSSSVVFNVHCGEEVSP